MAPIDIIASTRSKIGVHDVPWFVLLNTLQVAAYKTRAEADALAKRLKARGIDVRIAGTAEVFRVRIGHYATRAAAAAAAKELKAKKIDAFVTEIGSDDK